MRIHNWFRTIAGALALTASAETGFGQEFYGAPGQGMAAPGTGPANPAVIYPQGVPDGFNPWPQMSPYGVGNMDQEQLFNRNGLWFYEMLTKQRRFYGGMDAIWANVKGEGNFVIGSPSIPLDEQLNSYVGYNPPINGDALPIAVDPAEGEIPIVIGGADPYPFMFPVGNVGPAQYQFNDVWPLRYINDLPTQGNTGLEAHWGFDDADGVGLRVSGFYLGENSEVFQRGSDVINGQPVTPAMVDATLGQILSSHNGTIAYNNGFLAPLFFGGTGAAQKYDIMFRMEHRTEVAGANLAYYMAPVFKTSAVMVRPFLAGRYMYLNETFAFKGVDSGYHYDLVGFPYDGTADRDDPSTYAPDPETWGSRRFQWYPQFEARLLSNVQTHLAGPEVGLRYDLGEGDGFKIWGATTVGLMANQSNLYLNGNNIGEEFTTTFIQGGPSMLSNDARFQSEAGHGRVSPLFEQTIAVDSRIFEAVPYVNEIPVLNQAIFHFGYTFTAIGHVNRPADTINWAGYPLFPSLNNDTQTFVMQRFNFGLEWVY